MEVRMRFDDNRVDTSRVSDRRGARLGGGRGLGPGVALGGGGGIVGLIILAIFMFSGGADPSSLGGGGFAVPGSDETDSDIETRCNADPSAIDQYDDCFAIKVTNEIDEVW